MIGSPTATTSPGATSSSSTVPGVRAGQLDGGLRGLDLQQDLVDLHHVAGGDPPGQHLGLGQALARVGHPELTSHAPSRRSHGHRPVHGLEHAVQVGQVDVLEARRRVVAC